eukprot:485190-Amorphochlora_amoeboformis.AAC.1
MQYNLLDGMKASDKQKVQKSPNKYFVRVRVEPRLWLGLAFGLGSDRVESRARIVPGADLPAQLSNVLM